MEGRELRKRFQTFVNDFNNARLLPRILGVLAYFLRVRKTLKLAEALFFALGRDWERVKGIEPSYAAWEAAVLPLNYTRGVNVELI